ncbi:MAG: endonuclease [Deltaproteobacteria bacterium RIFCSPLOWO2_02_FULL_44_10]|nr:MAG: endonuclease [Deltaproteobacteria bacterium RIFCSPHIGHO2_02_FULL_44_16]OGQ45424.1 MAG: endonuclease [Deltaproteobacteria bacterium RIFCSPLOWO2_02_FULL_44_10]
MTLRPTKHFIYILQSKDGRYYTGYTTDLERRFKQHQSGVGGKFTRSFGATKILYQESFSEKSLALKREAEIKHFSRIKKEALVKGQ